MCANRSKKRPPLVVMAFMFIAVAALIILLLGTVVMYLWNALLPDIVGVKEISFWQAVGILILSRILFGGFHMGSKRRRHHKREFGNPQEKWGSMDKGEKAKFKEGWEAYCKKKENNN